MGIFQKHFDGKYEVIPWSWPIPTVAKARRDFWVKKNGFVGVAVKLEQTGIETKFVYTGGFSSPLAMILVIASIAIIIGVIGFLLCFLLWNGLTGEVRAFIESAPEFK